MTKRGKQYEDAMTKLGEQTPCSPEEAIAIARELSFAKFDETVELHIRTNADTRHADQLVRGTALLPHGIGKEIRVLVFAEGEAVSIANAAGADHAGADELIEAVNGGWTEFDIAIATPTVMGKIGKLGRVLGRKGLMPNPRTGTVVPQEDLPRVIGEAKQGRVEYRMDRSGIIHVPLGKLSFSDQQIVDNLNILVAYINKDRPPAVKGRFMNSATMSSTMGVGVPMDVGVLGAITL
jgi:large subunit ribosomal protein L1